MVEPLRPKLFSPSQRQYQRAPRARGVPMAQEIPVIDMWAPLVPTREIMAHVADNFPQVQLGYLRIFQKREPDLDAYRAAAPKMARDDAQILAELDAANVSRALVTGFDEASTAGKIFVTNDCVAAL